MLSAVRARSCTQGLDSYNSSVVFDNYEEINSYQMDGEIVVFNNKNNNNNNNNNNNKEMLAFTIDYVYFLRL